MSHERRHRARATCGCTAHARRKFDETLNTIQKEPWDGSLAMQGKRYCDQLFTLEKQLASCDAKMRQAEPILVEFLCWAKNCKAPPKSALG